MHHIHYFVVQATDAQAAMDTAEAYLEDWGTENNWRTVVGAFNRRGRKFEPSKPESNHFGMLKRSLSASNKMFQKMLDKISPEWMDYAKTKATIQRLVDSDFSPKTIRQMIAEKNEHNLWGLREFFQQVYAVSNALTEVKEGEAFNVFKHEFRSYKYDEIGVTHIDYNPDQPDDENYKAFCVLMDIHT